MTSCEISTRLHNRSDMVCLAYDRASSGFLEEYGVWKYGDVEVWGMEEWRRGSMGYGRMETWKYGVWKNGDVEVWKCESVGYGRMEMWNYGDVEVWKNGDVEVWRHGIMGYRSMKARVLKYGASDYGCMGMGP